MTAPTYSRPWHELRQPTLSARSLRNEGNAKSVLCIWPQTRVHPSRLAALLDKTPCVKPRPASRQDGPAITRFTEKTHESLQDHARRPLQGSRPSQTALQGIYRFLGSTSIPKFLSKHKKCSMRRSLLLYPVRHALGFPFSLIERSSITPTPKASERPNGETQTRLPASGMPKFHPVPRPRRAAPSEYHR